jgi:hypothetical protein
MLRGGREIDMVLTMEFWATGSITVDGKPCTLSSYRASLRYPPSQGSQNPRLPVPALRTDFACTSANGKPGPRQIHVVAGHLAWNERTPGLLAGPAPDTARERLLHVWTVIPEGVVKAAIAAGNAAELRTNAANPIVSFPLPAPFEAAIMTATFDSRIFRVDTNPAGVKREFSHLLQQTVTRIGTSVVETTYSDYGDWNDEDLKSMILLPRRIVQKKDGVTTLDLTITRSDTYNPYVVMPVPEGVARAAAQP